MLSAFKVLVSKRTRKECFFDHVLSYLNCSLNMELEPSSSFVVTLVKKVEYKYQKLLKTTSLAQKKFYTLSNSNFKITTCTS